MPVRAFAAKPVAPNPKLSVGQIYRITDTDEPYLGRRVGAYFSAIPTQGLIVYLASNHPITGGYDHDKVLERYNVSFEIVTLAEVSNV